MPVIFVTTDPTKWGDGIGLLLSPEQIDENFWTLLVRIIELETNPLPPVGITNIVVTGSQFKVFLSDGAELGPFDLPLANWTRRGEWLPNTAYMALDVIEVSTHGLFIVNADHVSALTFDPNAVDPVTFEPLYHQSFGIPTNIVAGAISPAYPALEHAAFGGF